MVTECGLLPTKGRKRGIVMKTLRHFDAKTSKNPSLKNHWRKLKKEAYSLCQISNEMKLSSKNSVEKMAHYQDALASFNQTHLAFKEECKNQGVTCPTFDHHDICRIAD